jgi:hypothetical protein
MTNSIQGVMNSGDIATAAQRQYFSRPADQKFDSVEALLNKVTARANAAMEFESEIVDMTAQRNPDGGIVFSAKPSKGVLTEYMQPTNYAFGQTCGLVKAPADFMRRLAEQGNEELVVKNLNHCIAKREKAGLKFLNVPDADGGDIGTLYSTTSPTYGRIWDRDVVQATKDTLDAVNNDAGKELFYSPWAWGKKHRALFGSDRDCFMFFCDGGSIVDGGGERDQLNRGVYVWNSEVGAATFGIATFLFRQCCGNFMIWGVDNAKILNIRHTSGGPARFLEQARPALNEFARSSVKQIESVVKAAKAFQLPTDRDEVFEFAMKHGFNKAEAKRAYDTAIAEEGQCATGFDLINGFTATARMMAYADAKVDLETRAGKLMDVFAIRAGVK